jgi:hypothetical protein
VPLISGEVQHREADHHMGNVIVKRHPLDGRYAKFSSGEDF